ncbi:Protein of unknown function [Quadrisphaera granulorum]|uniref:Uncharacterized protein DUF4229 n=1 Tax=Quadrisphaera granulorum TaxID=317664 RepID=A0A315ZHV9_9ACTN|nr:DUF4229 domain-containing protein [Quadrisphaera granulorum]PWJ45096.1 uncharacterized protein DUF4229 [Quadrisphaera granulorum]SZE99204.1 Protein of unknown function [Quadrisphaera granulorum]
MAPFLRYGLLRISLFFLVGLIGYAVGMRQLLLVAFAVIVSAVLSYLLLGGPRQVLVERLEAHTARRRERAAAREEERRQSGKVSAAERDAAVEDADDDAQRRAH